jgi:hypothetical protein
LRPVRQPVERFLAICQIARKSGAIIMRSPWPAGIVLLLTLGISTAASGSDGDAAAKYQEAVRCYNAAANYAQQYVVANEIDGATRMMGYRNELRGRAIQLGVKLGKTQKAVEAEFHNNDVAYLHKFYKFDTGAMVLSDFGTGEVAHCNLDKALQ